MEAPPTIHRLKVTLEDVTPPIWRQLDVPSSVTLHQLHRIVQIAMGWQNSHLHQFEAVPLGRRSAFGPPRPRLQDTSALAEVALRAGAEFVYVYDFGDDWRHRIVVDEVLRPEDGVLYPRCVAGEHACPPEDCGGVPGYASILSALLTPDDPDAVELLEWVGEGFDPDAFDLQATNSALTRLSRRLAISR